MPMHCLHAACSLSPAIDPITSDAATGMLASTSKLKSALRSTSQCSSRIKMHTAAMATKIDIAGSDTGMPPQNVVRNSDEYGLIKVSWQPSAALALLADMPGMNEQCRLCT